MSAMSRALIFALTLTAFTAKGDGELIAVADPISVDLRTESVLGVVGAAKLRYSPSWSSENGSVRIETVLGSTTNVIMTGGLKEEGEFIWAQPDADIPAYKLLLWTLSDGQWKNEPIPDRFVSDGVIPTDSSVGVSYIHLFHYSTTAMDIDNMKLEIFPAD